MHNTIEQEIQRVLANMDEQHEQEPETDTQTPKEKEPEALTPGKDETQEIQDIYVLVVRERAEPEDQETQTIIDSQEQPQPTPQPTPRREPPHLVYFVLILLLFLLLDSADTTLTALMTPTATITITPSVKTIMLTSSIQLGKLLSPITLMESQTVPTTGHGHQDAARATGSLTFYNGLSTFQRVAAGTILTGQDGISVITDAAVTIPPANPPSLGETSVTTHAVKAGTSGNIQAEDINKTLSAGLYIKNLAPFTGGQDSRDYIVVTKSDRDSAAADLKAKVNASMTAALQEQANRGEQVQIKPCSPTVTASHSVGEEATQLTVTVSQTCTAIAYNTQELTTQATKLLTTQAVKTVGTGYLLSGNVQVSVTKAITTDTKTVVLLAFTTQGTYVYQISAKTQQRIKNLVAGEPRKAALQQLVTLPGIQHVSISGIPDNQLIPDDMTHIHLLVILTVF